jgi:hypothetical protein
MRVSFQPLQHDAEKFITAATGIDFSTADFHTPRWFCCTAYSDQGRIMGVLACEFRHWFDAHFNCAIADRRCLSRRLLRAIFTALFSQARRISAEIEPGNRDAREQMQRLGFTLEGYQPRGYDGARDAMLFGMLPEDCRWLDVSRETLKEAHDGQGPQRAGSVRHG